MKGDALGKVIIILLGVLISIGGFIGAQLWEGVDIAKSNAVHVEHIRDTQKEIRQAQKEDRAEAKELRRDLDRFMSDVSDLSLRVPN